MTSPTARLDEQALAEALHQWEHGDRNPVAVIRSYLSALPAVPPSGGTEGVNPDEYVRHHWTCPSTHDTGLDCNCAYPRIVAALRSAVPEKPQEAVAWQVCSDAGNLSMTHNTREDAEATMADAQKHFPAWTGWNVRPLYAHPISPALVGDALPAFDAEGEPIQRPLPAGTVRPAPRLAEVEAVAGRIASELCEARYWLHPDSEHHDVQTCDACKAWVREQIAALLGPAGGAANGAGETNNA